MDTHDGRPERDRAETPAGPRRFGEGLRVLIVDDDALLVGVLGELLGELGFEVEEAGCLAAARVALARAVFPIVILDKNLPDGSGLALAAEIGGGPEGVDVLILTGDPDVTSAVEALRHRAADYLAKPIDLAELETRLARLVEDRSARLVGDDHEALARALRRTNRVLSNLASRDPVTGLWSHARFQEELGREASRCRRHGKGCTVLLVDLDRFAEVNATLGPAGGDDVLRAFAGLVGGAIGGREQLFRLDASDVAARFGGDAFAILLPGTSKAGGVAKAEALRRDVERASLGGTGVGRLTISAGVAGAPEDAGDRAGLLAAAADALDAARRAGGDRVVAFAEDLRRAEALPERRSPDGRQAALERTIARRSFQSQYQPIVRVRDWSILGYEALTRSTDPSFRSPEELIAEARRGGRMAALGRVLREGALAGMDRLAPPRLLFLNVHPHEILGPAPLDEEPVLRRWADRVVLELIECEKVADYGRLRARAAELRRLGFRLAIDDLGAGYSNLSSLALLEPDFVKLDLAMIRGIRPGSRAARLIQHILAFCKEVRIVAIAEGVETAEELDVLSRLGVPAIQGYFVARPAPRFAEIGPVPMPLEVPPTGSVGVRTAG